MTVYPNDCPEDMSSNTIDVIEMNVPDGEHEEPGEPEEPHHAPCADDDCENHVEVPIIKNIFFKTYEFCSEICAQEFEDHLRRSYRKSCKTT
jgi:hypothetical protein